MDIPPQSSSNDSRCQFDPPEVVRPLSRAAFSLVELLTVISIIAVLLTLILPAFNSLNTAGNIARATSDLADALEGARAYAMANNTYVWIGFFEEAPTLVASTPVAAGTGRIVLSVVASRDGTQVYNPNALPLTSDRMTQGLSQLSKLIKLENMHLRNHAAGSGTGVTFATRPAVDGNSQIALPTPAVGASKAPFQYPVGNPAPTARYVFNTAIEFSPRGEARINDASQPLQPVIEIVLQPTRGPVPDTNSANVAAVQVTGITGSVKIYRP